MQTMVSTAGAAFAGAQSAQRAESDDLLPGEKAGPWLVERELGRGGMGSVYAVTHEGIGKKAALKVMHRRLLASSSAERILTEARVVNQVAHPNIVDIFETGTLPDGRPYIVMERLEGVPLSQRADDGKILPDQVIGILLEVCDALIAAHAANVVHRDLKLDNVFLIDNPEMPSQPRVKVLDWGIAKDISDNTRHTIEGQLVGTPQYLSPEQARGATVTPQTDVYSLGVMAYELFLEQLPFEAETSAEIMAMHLRAIPPPPSELWPDIPPSLENLVLAMLEKDPDSRPTMLTVAHTLEIIRDEVVRRRESGVCLVPRTSSPSIAEPRRSSARHAVAQAIGPVGFAPTQLVETWPKAHKRWHVVVGALAIAASAFMFLFTRETEKAEAAAKPAPAAAIASAPETLASHSTTPAIADVPAPVQADASAVPAPTTPVTGAVSDAPASKPTTKRASSQRARRGQVKPHLSLQLDPDGTLDPYR